MDAASIVADWKRRLTSLAQNPDYVIRDTPRHLIEQHYRRLTTFIGYPESEVAEAEARLGAVFQAVFRTFVREMVKSPGDLSRGSDLAGITEFAKFRADALELIVPTDRALSLPSNAVVFMIHHGYTFVYIIASGGFDGSPMQWTENEREPREVAPTFAEMVDAELQFMESNNKTGRESGGYYLTLHPQGGGTESHPALASGERPLDNVPSDKRRWQLWR